MIEDGRRPELAEMRERIRQADPDARRVMSARLGGEVIVVSRGGQSHDFGQEQG